MAEKIRKLSNSEIEVLAKIVGECMTGTQMDSIFHECGVRDTSSESTKWKRIFYTFQAKQEIDGSSNAFLNFIKKSLNPVRFVSGKNGDHEAILAEINKPLLLMGLEMTNEGRLIKTVVATTVTHMVRNVTAHELKVKWVANEQDAIDILTTISFLHKQLDECFVVPQHII